MVARNGGATYLGPLAVGDAQKCLYHLRIEVAVSAGDDFCAGLGIRLCGPVGPVTGYRVKGVRYRENASIHMYRFAGKSVGVAATIKLLVMLPDDRRGARQKVYAVNYGQAVSYVLLHLNPLVRRERSRLQKYGVAHSDLAD